MLLFSRWALIQEKRLPGACLLCAETSHSWHLMKAVIAVSVASIVITITAAVGPQDINTHRRLQGNTRLLGEPRTQPHSPAGPPATEK